MKKVSTSVLLTIAIFLGGCATFVGPSIYPLDIRTYPPGAHVVITDRWGDSVFDGTTPATARLKPAAGYMRRAKYTLRISMPGYAEQTFPIKFVINEWYVGNLFIGGLIGWLIIDPMTGCMWKLETPPINTTLKKLTASVVVPTLNVVEKKDVPESLTRYMVRIRPEP